MQLNYNSESEILNQYFAETYKKIFFPAENRIIEINIV